MNLSVVQLFYLLALFWQKSSHALPALYPGSGLLKLVIDTELLHNKHYKTMFSEFLFLLATHLLAHIWLAGALAELLGPRFTVKWLDWSNVKFQNSKWIYFEWLNLI